MSLFNILHARGPERPSFGPSTSISKPLKDVALNTIGILLPLQPLQLLQNQHQLLSSVSLPGAQDQVTQVPSSSQVSVVHPSDDSHLSPRSHGFMSRRDSMVPILSKASSVFSSALRSSDRDENLFETDSSFSSEGLWNGGLLHPASKWPSAWNPQIGSPLPQMLAFGAGEPISGL